jgi:integration host factor subunit alpha
MPKEEDTMEFAVESLETPALTKAQLAELLFEQIGLNKRESKDMIDAFFDLIAAAWSTARTSRSPASATSRSAPRPRARAATRAPAKAIPIDARRVVTFHASHKLKEQIQGTAAAGDAADGRGRPDRRTQQKATPPGAAYCPALQLSPVRVTSSFLS